MANHPKGKQTAAEQMSVLYQALSGRKAKGQQEQAQNAGKRRHDEGGDHLHLLVLG